LEQNASHGGYRRFVLIEVDDRARTLTSGRLAEVPGGPPDYGFYTLAPDREELVVGRGFAAWRDAPEPAFGDGRNRLEGPLSGRKSRWPPMGCADHTGELVRSRYGAVVLRVVLARLLKVRV
jgi:hypothetical protein